MRAEYDFSKGERGKFYKPKAKLRLPVYLDTEVQRIATSIAEAQGSDLSRVVNNILKAEMATSKPGK